ncbi:MAG: hypothetical protein IKB82_03435 [Clostridia bacterium]|nr:hypothetical protein [Clostridia bacterium]
MRALISILLLALMIFPCCALAGEGDPLLSVDDLHTLEASYTAFLADLEELIIERGLLSESERQAWRDAQMGDFYQNGGYGSILANYMPGLLSFVREEDTMLTLSADLPCGTMTLSTVRRYTPMDSSLSGLMLTMSLADAQGMPADVTWQLSATSGLFLKWDPVLGSYQSVGVSAESTGETVCWSDQTPVQNANNPVITIDILDTLTLQPIGQATLTLTVDGDGYMLNDNALNGN